MPFLVQLAEQCGESSNLAVLEHDHVVYVAQAPGRHRMRLFTQVGRRLLPHSTAVGKVLLAWQDEDQVRRVVHRFGLPPRTPSTLTTVEAFTAELAVRVGERACCTVRTTYVLHDPDRKPVRVPDDLRERWLVA